MSGAETKSFDKPDQEFKQFDNADMYHCLLYTSDAADE